MQRFVEHRKQRIRKRIQYLPLQEGIDDLFEILKLDIIEDLKVSDDLLLESVEGKALQSIINKDLHNTRLQLEMMINLCRDHFFTGLLEEAKDSTPVKDLKDFQKKLKGKIGGFVKSLKNRVSKIISLSGIDKEEEPTAAVPPEEEEGRERAIGKRREEPEEDPGAYQGYYQPIDDFGGATGGYSYGGAGTPTDPGMTGRIPLPDAPEGEKKPSWWDRIKSGWKGIKNLWQQGKTGIGKAWRSELFPKESLEMAEVLIHEANLSTLNSISKLGQDLEDYITRKSDELLTFITTSFGNLSGQVPQVDVPPTIEPTIDVDEPWSNNPEEFLDQLKVRDPDLYKHWDDDVGEGFIKYIKDLWKQGIRGGHAISALKSVPGYKEEPKTPELPEPEAELPTVDLPPAGTVGKQRSIHPDFIRFARSDVKSEKLRERTRNAAFGKAKIDYGVDYEDYLTEAGNLRYTKYASDLMRAILKSEEGMELKEGWSKLGAKHFANLFVPNSPLKTVDNLLKYILRPQEGEKAPEDITTGEAPEDIPSITSSPAEETPEDITAGEAPEDIPSITSQAGVEQEVDVEPDTEEEETPLKTGHKQLSHDIFDQLEKEGKSEMAAGGDEEFWLDSIDGMIDKGGEPENILDFLRETLGLVKPEETGAESEPKEVEPEEVEESEPEEFDFGALDLDTIDDAREEALRNITSILNSDPDKVVLPSDEDLLKLFKDSGEFDLEEFIKDQVSKAAVKAHADAGGDIPEDLEHLLQRETAPERGEETQETEGAREDLSKGESRFLEDFGDFKKEGRYFLDMLRGSARESERGGESYEEALDGLIANAIDFPEYYAGDERLDIIKRYVDAKAGEGVDEENAEEQARNIEEEEGIWEKLLYKDPRKGDKNYEVSLAVDDLRERINREIGEAEIGGEEGITPEEEEFARGDYYMKPEHFSNRVKDLQKQLRERKSRETTFDTIKEKLIHS